MDRLESRRLLSSIVRVDVNSPAVNPDGTSWETAFPDLQQALMLAGAGDQIWIADGTYKPTSTTDRNISFQLKDQVDLLGGFAGFGAANPDQRDVAAFPSILSGDIGATGVASDNSYHVVFATQEAAVGSGTLIDGITITGGHSDKNVMGDLDSGEGGGMYLDAANPTITRCTYSNNLTTGLGAGVMLQRSSSPTFDQCDFANNHDTPNSPFLPWGGAVFGGGGSTTFIHCSFTGNAMASRGGAIYVTGGTMSFTGCSFTRNLGGSGGAIDVDSSATVNVTNCSFNGNAARGSNGGAINLRNGSMLNAVNCTFVGNAAASTSGIGSGGAVSTQGTASLVNCTIVDNAARTSGGGVSHGTVNNGIVWGNSSPSSPQFNVVTSNHSDVQGGAAGTGNIDADPQFVRSPSPGADGVWGTSDDDYGDLRVQITSPVIDVGDNNAVPPGVTTDIIGNPRFYDFPGVNDPGAIVDMGAYELTNRLGLLHVAAGQTLSLPSGNHSFFVEQLQIDKGGTLDVADDSLVIDYTGDSPLAGLADLIRSARNGGVWTGTGITSTAARNNPQHNTGLGAIEASDFKSAFGAGATFAGFSIDNTAVLIKYTYYGDTDLNGKVDGADYARIDASFNQQATQGNIAGWFNGDFDYNNKIDGADYALIDAAFNGQAGALRPKGRAIAEAR